MKRAKTLHLTSGKLDPVPLRDVERELGRRLQAVQGPGEAPIVHACMSNLVIYCDRADLAQAILAEVAAVVTLHPCRVLLLIAESGPTDGELTAAVKILGHIVDPGRWVCSEQVTLRATGRSMDRLPSAVRTLLIGDLPTNLWWATPQPPPLAGVLLYELAEHAQQIIYDSIGWPDPARGVVATAAWLEQVEAGEACAPPGSAAERGRGKEDRVRRWRVVSDLNWRRLKYWRRLLSQALDPASAPGALESVTEVLVEHGPHAVIQAWELVSWLAARLGWRVQAGSVEPGVEIGWQFRTPQGSLRVHIRRLAEGPSEVRRVRLACTLEGKPSALVFVAEEGRLAVTPEDAAAAPRTMAAPQRPLAELVGRQLSDRELDPVFYESMRGARVLAQSVNSH
jgi:glucose-6-phosphate dehydrogenase assembly protein OpcA